MTTSRYLTREGDFLDHSETIPLIIDAQRGDKAAMEKLLQSHYPLINKIAFSFYRGNIQPEDLVHEGIIGFMKAVHAYRPDSGVFLTSHSTTWVVSEILNHIYRNRSDMYTLTTKTTRKIANRISKYTDIYGHVSPEAKAEMAQDLNVSIASVEESIQRIRYKQEAIVIENDQEQEDFYGVTESSLPAIPSSEYDVIEADYHEKIMERLHEALNEKMPQRDREIFMLRHQADEPHTLADLSERYSISGERVRQIEKRVLDRLRETIADLAA